MSRYGLKIDFPGHVLDRRFNFPYNVFPSSHFITPQRGAYAYRQIVPDSTQIDPQLRATLDSTADAEERAELEDDLAREALGYQMWTNTAYEGVTDHGDHLHVRVRVDVAYTQAVLIRTNGTLKIHPDPSTFSD